LKVYPGNHKLASKIIVHHTLGRTVIRFQSLDHKQDIWCFPSYESANPQLET
jgi:hypothetical protein